ncbi:DASH complex subunit duo1 [Fulvia fulva]|uniref:DASH complex subunit DUO1 n=1 Tax=Passalora fulva TaxID=5499 RepID=A0A9Q8PCX6_PASFU|nr:DASH complex subunit duo1 [Fulvia fulva]KAK4619557.1 DASH complex subunit duo1 [Fulvia fulva]KAK4620848.1 DASH complex subunit duo1 [Fulvia fulva]UJO20164.1 DASH complex subunit duo1 [Fulvia fulva]WPV17349.1 DASH complex subunit duo1 [Fulvia fulva]WPV32186.1 DASH complex subunit duo1 [Fulvia fulva]
MSKNAPDISKLRLNGDQFDEDLFASPDPGATTQKHTPASNTSSAQKQNAPKQAKLSKEDMEEARDAQLRAELEKVREVNKVIEGVTASLAKAKDNMSTVQSTVNSASTLLATWTRILSQTEHNQRLILNPQWQGATQDLEDVGNDELRRHQEAERRVMEEQRRREEAERRREEEERKRAAGEAKTAGRGLGRTRSTRGGGYTADGRRVGGATTPTSRGRDTAGTRGTRGTAGVGRGTSAARGRGRGLG